MKAIILNGFGGVENFETIDIEMPSARENEVLVQVKSISINPVDAKTRVGKGRASFYKDVNPIILGWDVSGVVKEVGAKVTKFKKGDEVFGMIDFPGQGKAYAEYVTAPAAHFALKPGNITHEEAAAATLAALTAYKALELLELKKGEKILIHAAAGGVGHYAVQMAKHIGARVTGTASEKNRALVKELGADEFIDYKSQKLAEATSGIDKVLDAIGGENIDESLEVMKPGGIILSIPAGKNDLVGEKAEAKGMKGFVMMVNSNDHHIDEIASYLEKRIIKSVIYKTYSFNQIPEAHLQIESGTTVGKIIINI
ncbi:NADP-dependent oxidoreductase [Pedobacter punctiformis]|uniref:NADP-dependent oxidoreductase n=1 Tax=Pedobacter punctiformis TaxID=3004097 RepID=A0ABT4LD63_9SPHI|nr:NADP-dependent oxidoreductase [Pedobacter sp. HCMS5-2]MCZ4245862.1 NADP-dependent oxidoreductase [Pedobacter sp. HCMS5-2]